MKLLMLCLLLTCSFSYAEEFTLLSAVEKTIETNPEVQAAYNKYRAAIQQQMAAQGGFYPHLNLISEARNVQGQSSATNYNSFVPEYLTTLVLRQMIFDGFGTLSEVRRLDHAARTAFFELEAAMQKTALGTVKAYLEIQKYRKFVTYAEDNFAVHKQLFDLVEQRVVAGVGRRVDLEQGSGRLALAEANLLTESNNLIAVTATFQRLTGELPPQKLQEVTFFSNGVEGTAADALDAAYKKNPVILASIENIVSSQQAVKVKQSEYYPKVDLMARHMLNVAESGANSFQAADIVEVTMNYNIFNGLTDKSLISETTYKLDESHELKNLACINTREELVIAYSDILNLKSQLSFRDQHQLSIEKAREAYRKQFSIGQRTLLDLLDSENEYFNARRNYTLTELDLYAAYARTYSSQGEILRKLNVFRSDLPEVELEQNGDEYKGTSCSNSVAPELKKINKDEIMLKAKPLSPEITQNISREQGASVDVSNRGSISN